MTDKIIDLARLAKSKPANARKDIGNKGKRQGGGNKQKRQNQKGQGNTQASKGQRKDRRCFNCGEPGHLAKYCSAPAKDEKSKK